VPVILGCDIGGVNTKAVRLDDDGTLHARSRAFELQRDPGGLVRVLTELASELGVSVSTGLTCAVTMTAELSQMFRTKRDGVEFVLDAVATAFPDADITLDIRHVEEKLWHTGEAFHAAQTEELKMWVEHHRTLLYAGRARDLVQALDALHAQLPTHAHRKRSRVAKLANYLRKRLPMMNYKELIQRDLEIASGVVEGATRYVIGERLDCSGMRWLEGRAEALLRLRCLELNGQWDSFLEWAQQDWLLRLSAKKPVRIRTVAPMDLSVAA